ncbi:MAG: hypothetical protein R6U39_08730 [Candidatus Aegiribacteria sp.]
MGQVSRYLVLVILALVLTALIYAPLLDCFFDPQEFKSVLNPLVARQPMGQYLAEAWGQTVEDGTRLVFFRPLTSISFLLDYHLWGIAPTGYRLFNVLIHLTIVFLTIPLARRLGVRKFWWFPPLVMICHPGCMEAVWLIVARHDLLAAGFSLLALILTLDVKQGKLRGAAGSLPFLAALLAAASKEQGMVNFLTLPLLFLLWPDGKPDRRARIWFWASLPMAALLTLGSRLAVFGTHIGGYGGYTPLKFWPMEMYTVILQASGAFYMSLPLMRYTTVLLVAAILVSPLLKSRRRLRRYGTIFLVLSAYSAQALLAGPAKHYVYALAASAALILGWALEHGWSGARRPAWMRFAAAAVFLVLLLLASLKTQSQMKVFWEPARSVYEALENRADEVAALDSVAVVLSSRSPEGEECRLIRRFLLYLRPDSDVRFRYVRSVSELRPGEDYLVWESDSLALRATMDEGAGHLN